MVVQPEGADEVDRLSRRKTFPSQDFAHSEDDIVNEVLVSPPLQTMSIRSAIVQPEGADEVDRLSRRKTLFPCPAGNKRTKSLKDLFEDLDVKTDRCIRYKRRSMERRSALSMVSHPPFETKLSGDDDEAEDPDLDAVSVEERDHCSLTDGEKVLILRSAGLLGIQDESSRGALWNSVSPEGTGIPKGVGLIVPTRTSSLRASKRGSSLSDLVGRTISSKNHTRDIMVQKRRSFVSSHMLKRGKLINEGIGSIRRNPEVLRRVSFVEDTKDEKTRGSVIQVEKLLEPVSNTIRRTTSFLDRFNAEEELKETNTLRRIGDTQCNTISRTTASFLSLFKAGNPGEEQEENVLLESMTKRDSMNLVQALRSPM